jgi:hypothetical protein
VVHNVPLHGKDVPFGSDNPHNTDINHPSNSKGVYGFTLAIVGILISPLLLEQFG